MTRKPLVSVLIPLYNGSSTILSTLQSVASQSCSDFEILVLNDASTDDSIEVMRKFCDPRLRVIHNEKNEGTSFTRDRLVREAQGDYVAWLDQDDLAVPERLEKQCQRFRSHPRLVLSGGWSRLVKKDFRVSDSLSCRTIVRHQFFVCSTEGDQIRARQPLHNQFSTSTIMMNRRRTTELKLDFHAYSWPVEDFAYWTAATLRGAVENVGEILAIEREAGLTKSKLVTETQKSAASRVRQDALADIGMNREDIEILDALAAGMFLNDPDFERLARLPINYAQTGQATSQERRERADYVAFLILRSLRRAQIISRPGSAARLISDTIIPWLHGHESNARRALRARFSS